MFLKAVGMGGGQTYSKADTRISAVQRMKSSVPQHFIERLWRVCCSWQFNSLFPSQSSGEQRIGGDTLLLRQIKTFRVDIKSLRSCLVCGTLKKKHSRRCFVVLEIRKLLLSIHLSGLCTYYDSDRPYSSMSVYKKGNCG